VDLARGRVQVQVQKLAVPAERAMALAETKNSAQVPSMSNASSEYVLSI
jgi:hypothetical protein